jgi:hypothetical protein
VSSAPSYDAAVAFLIEDVATTIQAEQPSLGLEADAVVVARASRGSWPRRSNPRPISVEIVPRGEVPVKAVGIGYDEIGQVFDLLCHVRRKAKAQGDELLDVAEDMARALAYRYRLRSDLEVGSLSSYCGPYFTRPYCSVPYFGLGAVAARFLRCDAKRVELDPDPDAGELARAVTRVTFTFLQRRASA